MCKCSIGLHTLAIVTSLEIATNKISEEISDEEEEH